jgi:hypothetical protein
MRENRAAESEERDMLKTLEAVIEKDGHVRLLEEVQLPEARRALVTILEDESSQVSETALLSELALAEDWDRHEEDDAWRHLQRER